MRNLIIIAGMLFGAVAANAAGTPAEKCQAGKTQEAGNYASCRLKAQAKLTQGGDLERYNTALDRCAEKLEKRFLKLEAEAVARATTCPTTNDAADAIALVGSCADTVADGTSPGGNLPGSCNSDCGDGSIDAGEDCDQGNLNGGTCAGEGFLGGDLRCAGGCVFDTSDCYASRFVDNANGTITDNQTGLMWEKKVKLDGSQDLSNLQDADNTYRWSGVCEDAFTHCQPDTASELVCLAGVEGSENGCRQCYSGVCVDGAGSLGSGGTVWEWLAALNAASFGGHSDWRLATVQELQGILDYSVSTPPLVSVAFHGASCGVACGDLNDSACSCTQADGYWSASTCEAYRDNAQFVLFDGRGTDEDPKRAFFFVRAVRSGS